MLYVISVRIELADGSLEKHPRSNGCFKRDRRALVNGLFELGVDLVVMESTGSYWKSIDSTLEHAGIPAHVVNARCLSKTYRAARPIGRIPSGSPNSGGSVWSNRVSFHRKTCVSCASFPAIGKKSRKPGPGKKPVA
ncbi:MAG: hypothetical protein ACREDU_06265 [Methylocella sp.]